MEKTTANSSFAVRSWEENPFNEFGSERKLTQANVKQTYEGDMSGESEVKYLMCYTPNGASFVGIEFFTGSIGGRTGSFVLQHEGEDEGGGVFSRYFVVPGSGTDGLEGLRGEGNFSLAGQAERYPLSLDFWFE